MHTTLHPFQIVGAHAAAQLAGCPLADMTDGDWDRTADLITNDATAAACAPKNGPGYAWWLALNAMFPNSPATHAARKPSQVGERLAEQFAPDDNPAGPCWLCGTPAEQRWGKDRLPLAQSANHVNAQPAGGQLVCRTCRISLWALPYGSIHNGGHVATLIGADSEVTRLLVNQVVDLNQAAIREQRTAWDTDVTHVAGEILQRVLVVRPGQVEWLLWRNDNREPALRQWVVTEEVARWLANNSDDPEHRAGLWALAAAGGGHVLTVLRVRPGGDPLAELTGAVRRAVDRVLSGPVLDAAAFGSTRPLTRLVLSAAKALR